MNKLFRNEVLATKKERLWGDVLLTQPFSYKLFSLAIILSVIAIITILLNGEYSRREKVRGYITTDKGVIKIFPTAQGILFQLNIKEGQQIKKGETLAIVNTAKKNSGGDNIPKVIIRELNKQKKLIEHRISQEIELHTIEVDKLKKNIDRYKSEKTIAIYRLGKLQERILILKSQFDKILVLKNKGYLSEQKTSDAKGKLLQLQADIQSVKQGNVSLDNKINNALFELKLAPLKTNRSTVEYKRLLLTLEQQIIETASLDSYSIKSNINGRITSIQSKVGQTVSNSSPIFAILPNDAMFQAELFIPSRAIGFIEPGKEVKIRYDAFPYQRFGLYEGIISNVAESIFLPGELPIPVRLDEPVYRAKVVLSTQYVKAFSKKLSLQSGMLLDADVILEKRTFIEWLLEPLYNLRGSI